MPVRHRMQHIRAVVARGRAYRHLRDGKRTRSRREPSIDGGDGFRVYAEWRAVGEVTHWGHTHKRPNLYHAWLAIEPRQGSWKMTEIEDFTENRL